MVVRYRRLLGVVVIVALAFAVWLQFSPLGIDVQLRKPIPIDSGPTSSVVAPTSTKQIERVTLDPETVTVTREKTGPTKTVVVENSSLVETVSKLEAAKVDKEYEFKKSQEKSADIMKDLEELYKKMYEFTDQEWVDNEILSSHELMTDESVGDLTLSERCDSYFDKVFSKTGWDFSMNDKLTYYSDALDEENYLKSRMEDLESLSEKMKDKKLKLRFSKEEFERRVKKTRKIKLKINEMMTRHLENYNSHIQTLSRCFLSKSNVFGSSSSASFEEKCESMEMAMFPWLSREMPLYYKYDNGEKVVIDVLPQETKCFSRKLQSTLQGRGIVISGFDDGQDELAALLVELRALGNKYPIQIVHKGDLSHNVELKLVHVARTSSINLSPDLPNVNGKVDATFPPLELEFVDVSKCILDEYAGGFYYYFNKLLAYTFNSFEEMIMLDADTVPLAPMESFFDIPAYKEHGAYFFHDRGLREYNDDRVVDFVRDKLLPKASSYWKDIFTPNVAENDFFSSNTRHNMESGLFIINRATHFAGILTSVQMMFLPVLNTVSYGDKEYIWLGQMLSGNSFKFNHNFAVAIGEYTDVFASDETISHELCTNHPGHVSDSDNRTLLWINSGFTHCKKRDYISDDLDYYKTKKGETSLTMAELSRRYRGPFKIRSMISPPPSFKYSAGNQDYNSLKHFEPQDSWKQSNLCQMYTWCAYDIIGGAGNADVVNEMTAFEKFDRYNVFVRKEPEVIRGYHHDYSSEEYTVFDFLAMVWNDHYGVSRYIELDEKGTSSTTLKASYDVLQIKLEEAQKAKEEEKAKTD